MYGASAYAVNLEVSTRIRDLHIGIAATSLSQNLDSHVDGVIILRIIGYFFAKQNDGRSAFLLRQIRHLQIFGRNRRPVSPGGVAQTVRAKSVSGIAR